MAGPSRAIRPDVGQGPRPISDIAHALGIRDEEIDLYGRHKAKIRLELLDRFKDKPDGKLILVTGMTPTTAGEGKTTVTVGLGQALAKLGKSAMTCLRQPSLGPVFGVKGGATGGGRAQVVPVDEINLHFTGDFHAVSSAHNLLAALVDNHLHHHNKLGIDPRRVTWRRVIDMNDRALTNILVGLGGPQRGVPRETGFDITPASEVMAILCLTDGVDDLKARLGRIVVGETFDRQPVTAAHLEAASAMALLLRDALLPNLVQNLEYGPAIVHGGPFANIAHGSSSILGTRMGLKLADYVVTEAGFGADLGAEKFFNITCRKAGFRPAAAVIVASIRALKRQGGVKVSDLDLENLDAVAAGIPNLEQHFENVRKFGVEAIVALNRFGPDTDAEIAAATERCRMAGIQAFETTAYRDGGDGALELASAMIGLADRPPAAFRLLYPDDMPLQRKIETIATEMYGAGAVSYAPAASQSLKRLEGEGYGKLPVCMAKTQFSFTDNPRRLGRPRGFELQVREARLSAGAGFVVAYAGDVLTMPGLPETPSVGRMTIDSKGRISGLS